MPAAVIPVEDVNRAAMRKIKPHAIGFVSASAFLLVGAVVVKSVVVLQTALLPLLLLLVDFLMAQAKAQREFMRQFAVLNGFAFQEEGNLEGLKGMPFSVGTDRKTYNVVSGTYAGHPFRMFNYSYAQGSGKNKRMYHTTVFEITHGVALPSIFLESAAFGRNTEIRVSKYASRESLQFASEPRRIALGAPWDACFRLHVPEDYEIEAFQMFPPAVLDELAQYYRGKHMNFSVEFAGDALYVYMPSVIRKMDTLRTAYSLAAFLAEKLGPELKRMRRGLEAQREVYGR